MKHGAVALILMLFLGMHSADRAEPASGNLPDIPGAEKTVWHCDAGATTVIIYLKANEWWRSVILTEIKIFAVESAANGTVRYFTALYGETKLHEISAEQYKSDLAFASQNYVKRMLGGSSDCVKL